MDDDAQQIVERKGAARLDWQYAIARAATKMKLLSEELMRQLSRAALAKLVMEAGGVARFQKRELIFDVTLNVLVDGEMVSFEITGANSN